MRNIFIIFFLVILEFSVSSQEKIYIHKSDKITLGALISATDSMFFSSNSTVLNFRINKNQYQYPVSDVDSISFGANSGTVSIIYNGNTVSVFNPLAFEGVAVDVNQSNVIIRSTIADKEITYNLKGNSQDGSFRIYSDNRIKLELNNLNLTNADGPAINIQTKKKVSVNLVNGSSNSLVDGITYTTSTEDQKGAFFSEGQLEFDGTGKLSVKSNSYHAICSDDYINVLNGNISVLSAGKDGIHSKEFFRMSDGELNIMASSDGIDCEEGHVLISGGKITIINSETNTNSIKSDSTLIVSGGTLNLTVGGLQSKGLKSDGEMELRGGFLTINTSGGAQLNSIGSGFEPSFCVAVKSGKSIQIGGVSIIINATGAGGKGISADGNLIIEDGTIKITTSGNGATYKNGSGISDSYNATCLSADGNITINYANLTLQSSGTGGKGINGNGKIFIGTASKLPVINITTSGTKFVESGSGTNVEYNEPKTLNADGEIKILNGDITINSNDDGIKSKTSITIDNGKVNVGKSTEGIESKFIYINGGNVNVTSSDDAVNTSMGLVNGGTESNDGSHFYMNGGYTVLSVTNGDAIDSNGNMTMTGGTLLAYGPSAGANEDIDINGTLLVNGGLLFGCSTNSRMNKPINSLSTQYGLIIITTAGVTSGNIIRIQDATGNNLGTFKLLRNGYYFHFSSSELKNGSSYSVYTGGTCTGNLTDGMYTGGTYTGGTLKKTFTISSKITTISF